MAFKDYDGLDIDKAIAKLKAKSIYDAEDIAFAKARRDMLTDLELAAITGEEVEETNDDAGNQPGNEPQAPIIPPAEAPEGVELVTDKLKLEELQAIALEHGLDTSGIKKDLIERINAFRTEEAAKTA